MLPVGVVLLLFWLMARDSPSRGPRPSLDEYRAVLREPDIVSLSFLYGLTFGGFVGLASFLTGYFHEQYQLSRVTAGDFTTVVVVAGSALRPVGGWLSDRMGGYRLLVGLLAGFAACLAVVAMTPPPLVALGVLFVGMGLLGTGNGAVFQLVPQRFSGRIGIATGIVGAAGGLGGFFPPLVMGIVKSATGGYALGFALMALVAVACLVVLRALGSRRAGPAPRQPA
jgi:NNP family nitrate/nitrite transporter-like MFS transporter